MEDKQVAETIPDMMNAMHAHIQQIAARPLDARMLVELEKTCLLVRELLSVGQDPNALNKRSLVSPSYIGVGGYDNFMVGQQAISPPAETFGVTAIRELVAALAPLLKNNLSPASEPVAALPLQAVAP